MTVSPIELAADVLTLASVVLTVFLRTSLYPVGIAATVLFFFVASAVVVLIWTS